MNRKKPMIQVRKDTSTLVEHLTIDACLKFQMQGNSRQVAKQLKNQEIIVNLG